VNYLWREEAPNKEGLTKTELLDIMIRVMPKRTYQPKKGKRAKKHGFLKRRSSPGGKNVLQKRRTKGRKKLTV